MPNPTVDDLLTLAEELREMQDRLPGFDVTPLQTMARRIENAAAQRMVPDDPRRGEIAERGPELDEEVSDELLDPEGAGYVPEPPWDDVAPDDA